jgi:uncharacterized protein (TIGR03435 family)
MRSRLRPTVGFLLMATACVGLHAQAAPTAPEFEVASVKVAPPGGPKDISGGPGTGDPERFTVVGMSLGYLIRRAYNIQAYQMSGSPDWMPAARFNVVAKVPPGTTSEQFRLMLQNLLAERAGLKVHWETKEMAGYTLVLAKGGPKLRESLPGTSADSDQRAVMPDDRPLFTVGANGFPLLAPGDEPLEVTVAWGKTAERAGHRTAQQIAETFSANLGCPVIDGTGLMGVYDYTLYFQLPFAAPRSVPGRSTPLPPAEADTGPNLFEAVQKQLGLKLEPRKAQVEILVIDHAERTPAAN